MVVALGWLLVHRHVRAPMVIFAATALLTFSFALVQNAEQVLSETMFLAVALVALLALENAVTYGAKRGVVWSAATGITIGFAFVIRSAALAPTPANAPRELAADASSLPTSTRACSQASGASVSITRRADIRQRFANDQRRVVGCDDHAVGKREIGGEF
jgi:hypothetical protein